MCCYRGKRTGALAETLGELCSHSAAPVATEDVGTLLAHGNALVVDTPSSSQPPFSKLRAAFEVKLPPDPVAQGTAGFQEATPAEAASEERCVSASPLQAGAKEAKATSAAARSVQQSGWESSAG